MNLGELLRDTEALTYINALKVTLTEIKSELAEQEKLREHMNLSSDKTKRLLRKADNHYRLIAKIVTHQGTLATGVSIVDDLKSLELEELMEEG